MSTRRNKNANNELDKILNNLMTNINQQPGPMITVNGESGEWVNKHESDNWIGDVPLSQYPIHIDSDPLIINKKYDETLNYDQQFGIRYIKPHTPVMDDLIINQEPDIQAPEAPPIVIRQKPEQVYQPESEVFYREKPPQPPKKVEPLIVKIPGKRLPPPPRKVIIEIVPEIPDGPPPILLERWLTPKPVKRRVIFERSPVIPSQAPNRKPEVIINKKYYYIDSKDVDIKMINSNEKMSKSSSNEVEVKVIKEKNSKRDTSNHKKKSTSSNYLAKTNTGVGYKLSRSNKIVNSNHKSNIKEHIRAI